MNKPKLGILKKVYLTNRGHYRYYSPYYDRIKLGNIPKRERPKMPILNLNHINITTEKELCRLIFNEFGEGDYRIVAYIKGRKGCWTFFKGIINAEGYIKEKRVTSYKKNVDRLKEKLAKATDEIDREDILDDIEIENASKSVDYEITRYGLAGFLKSSSRGGELVLWNDIEFQENKEDWNEKKKEVDEDDWGVSNVKKEVFEEWI